MTSSEVNMEDVKDVEASTETGEGVTGPEDVEAETSPDETAQQERAAKALAFKEVGNKYFKAQQYYEAEQEYTKAIETDPSCAAYYNNRAAALLQQTGKTLRAIADSKKAVELEANNVKALVRLAKAALRRGLFDDAICAAKNALKVSPTNSVAREELKEAQLTQQRCKRAKECLAAGDTRQAQAMAEAGLRRSPESKDLMMVKVECMIVNDQYDHAYNLTNKLIREYRSDVKLLYLRAQIFYHMENFDQAINHLQQALMSDPDNSQCAKMIKKVRKLARFRQAGNDAFKARQYQKAVEEYTKGLELDQSNKSLCSKLFCNRGTALTKLRKNEEAIKDFDKAVELNPDYGKAYLRRAACLVSLGGVENLDKAMHNYNEAEKHLGNSQEIRQGKRQLKIELKKAKRKDYYKILNLSNKEYSSEAEIKKAYKKSAMKWHPDKHASKSEEEREKAEAAFKDVGEAYAVLSDPQKKEKYDSGYSLEEIEQGGGMGGMHMDQEDLMRMFFGGGGHAHGGFGGGGVRFGFG